MLAFQLNMIPSESKLIAKLVKDKICRIDESATGVKINLSVTIDMIQ